MLNITVSLNDPESQDSVNKLRAYGMTVEQHLADVGVVTGTVEEDELQGLIDLHVGAVEIDREVTTQEA